MSSEKKDKYSWMIGNFTKFFTFTFRSFKDRIHAEVLLKNANLPFGTDHDKSFNTVEWALNDIINVLKKNKMGSKYILFREFVKNNGTSIKVNIKNKAYKKHWG